MHRLRKELVIEGAQTDGFRGPGGMPPLEKRKSTSSEMHYEHSELANLHV